jgi:hypothetical protein
MQPIAPLLRLNHSSSKYIHETADSIIHTLNQICSWMPAVQAHVHPPHSWQYRLPNRQEEVVALT